MSKKLLILTMLVIIALLPITAHAVSTTIGSGSKGDAPVAYWNFDESGGPTAYDKSGNNNNGTLIAGGTGTNLTASHMWTPEGKFGGAMEFDGDDYASMGSTLIGASFTVTGWFYPNDTGMVWWQSETQMSFSGGISCRLYIGASYYLYANSLPSDQWYHFAVTWDGNTGKLYVNGVLKDTNSDPSGSPGGGAFYIGKDESSPSYTGLVDEFKIYDYVRTPDQVKQDYAGGAAAHMGGSPAFYDPWDGNPPVAWWSMDENTGITAYDRSGGGNDGTITNAAWAHGKYGSCLSFDGNDKVTAGTTNISSGSSARTFEAWVNPSGTGGVIVGTNAASGQKYYVEAVNVSGTWFLFTDGVNGANNITLTGTEIPPSDSWSHIAFVLDGSNNWKYFLNGILKKNGTFSVAINTATPTSVTIGERLDVAGYSFNGRIDEILVYNYARTQAQIAWDYNKGKPVGHWKMDEALSGAVSTASGAIKDASGHDNNGTASNTTWSYATGKFGGALSFDGDDYVDCGNPESLQVGGQATIEAWVYHTENIWQYFIHKGYAQNNSFYFGYHSSEGKWWGGTYYDGYHYMSFGSGDLNRWVHLAITFDKSLASDNFKFYEDGNYKGSDNWTYDIMINSTNLTLGSSRCWQGKIDNVRIYNYARTAGQIKQDYAGGAAMHLGGVGDVARDGTSSANAADSALAIKRNFPSSTDGTYWIDPDGEGGDAAYQVYCDMTTDGGGWTLIASAPATGGMFGGRSEDGNIPTGYFKPTYSYGTYNSSGAIGDYYLNWNAVDSEVSEILFKTGNNTYWMVMNKSDVSRIIQTTTVTINASSGNLTGTGGSPNTVGYVMARNPNGGEDPWINSGDTHEPGGMMFWGENGYVGTHNNFKNNNGGLRVFIR